ncbi:MAG: hypothetical protein ACI39F_04415 [Acutalibacteraceae bacterium]
MGKFKKNTFVAQYKANEREKAKQEQLHKKYAVADDVKIVEKSNMAKFTVNMITRILKFIAGVLIIIFAIIGIYALVVTEIREPLLINLKEIWQYVLNALNL